MPALNGPMVVSRLLAILPELETVTLYSMKTDGSYPVSGVSWTAKREPLNVDDMVNAGIEVDADGIKFTMLDTSAGGTMTGPQDSDKVVDATSQAWTVRHTVTDMFKMIHHATCIINR